DHRLRVFAAALCFRPNLASKLLVAVVCLPPSYLGQALPFRAIGVGREYLALKTPHARAGAIPGYCKLRGRLFKLWRAILVPQIMRLLHVNVTVHDLEALLHCAIPLTGRCRRPSTFCYGACTGQ